MTEQLNTKFTDEKCITEYQSHVSCSELCLLPHGLLLLQLLAVSDRGRG